MYETCSCPFLRRGVDGDVRHRAGPVERAEGDQVLELGRLHLAQRLAHARRLELEHAGRLAAGEHLVGLAIVEGNRGDLEVAADERDRLVDHVEVPQAEEVDLQEAQVDDVAHRELGHDLLVGALLLERHDVGQRPVGDDDAGGVDRVGADEALERPGEVDDLAHQRVGVVGGPELLARLQAVVEVDLRAFGDQLRDPVDRAVGDLEHAAGVADGGARHHRPEGDDLGDAVAAVLLGDVVDHPVAAATAKSMSMSGRSLRAGLRKRSNRRPYRIGSTSVISRQ